MSIQIENSGSTIKVTENGGSYNIAKPFTITYSPDILQPDGTTLNGRINVFFSQGTESKQQNWDWTEITNPAAISVEAMKNAIEAFQDTGIGENVAITSPLGQQTMANSVSVTVASNQTPVPVKPLLAQGTGRVLTTTGTSANTALTAGIKAVSIYARNSDAYYSIGNAAQTASAATGFIASGERLDLDVSGYATPNIAVIFGPSAAAAILMVTELS